jgi:hypothetical protein
MSQDTRIEWDARYFELEHQITREEAVVMSEEHNAKRLNQVKWAAESKKQRADAAKKHEERMRKYHSPDGVAKRHAADIKRNKKVWVNEHKNDGATLKRKKRKSTLIKKSEKNDYGDRDADAYNEYSLGSMF